MKKFSVLPLAEQITADNIYSAPTVKKLPFVKIPPAVYIVLAVIAFIATYTDPFLSMILMGLLLMIASIDSKTGNSKKGRTFEKVLWLRIPIFLMGIFFLITGIFVFLTDNTARNSNTERSRAHYLLLFKLFVIAGGVLLLSRLIILVTNALAIQSRRNTCGTLVHIEPDITAVNSSVNASNDTEYNRHVPVYKYYFEGKGYRFTDHARELYFFSSTDSSLVYVDPQKPDRYYSPNLFSDNGEKLIEFLKLLGYLFVSSLPFLVRWLLNR